jgi:hypothetical protein
VVLLVLLFIISSLRVLIPSISYVTFKVLRYIIVFYLVFFYFVLNFYSYIILVCLQPIACWDCGFESRRGHGCLSVVSVVCCHVDVCDWPIPRPEESYRL